MKKIGYILITLLLLIPSAGFSVEKPGWKWVSAKRVHDLVMEGSGLWLVDVRSGHAFEKGHIEGAMNIPSMSLKVKTLPAKRFVVLVDDSLGGRLSLEAAHILVEKGLKKVYVMKGGINAWAMAGYPVYGEAGGLVGTVTVRDLSWAREKGTAMTVYDLRGKEAAKAGTIPGAVVVVGTTLDERVDNLQEKFSKERKSKNLAKRLKSAAEVVLVFSASDDAAMHAGRLAFGTGRPVRYLLGGYETFAMAGKRGEKKTIGECSVCPNAKK